MMKYFANGFARPALVGALLILAALYAHYILAGPATEAADARQLNPVEALLAEGEEEEPVEATPEVIQPDLELMEEAARTAWRYMEQFDDGSSGLTMSVAWYPYATIWDLGSMLAALHSANALGLLSDSAYLRRTTAALDRIGRLDLVGGIAPNKFYRTDSGAIADRAGEPSHTGSGWSAVDLGRLLIWLEIVSHDSPELRELAETAVSRLALERLTQDGLLWGGAYADDDALHLYQEGRLGYEQYAAEGFRLWGLDVSRAADPARHAKEIEVMGVPLIADSRRGSCLTSEPFILWGIELGMPPWANRLASRVLLAQQKRFESTGILTAVSEDAITVAPHYFLFYCVHANGDEFPVLTGEYVRDRAAPRTISTKAAFGWYALRPGPYTERVARRVAEQAGQEGQWAAGVTEADLKPLGASNINTAAVILEAALYARDGVPLLERTKKSPRPDNTGPGHEPSRTSRATGEN